MSLPVDAYYDITCSKCAKSRSTDFQMGMMTSKPTLQKYAQSEGWQHINGKTYCPECAKALLSTWLKVEENAPPVLHDFDGLESKTRAKYWVIAHDGMVVKGHIYKNQYSTTGYAVQISGDTCVNNVTHWMKPIKRGARK